MGERRRKLEIPVKPEWMALAKCRGPLAHLFYPDTNNAEVQRAKRICNGGPPKYNRKGQMVEPTETTCPVRDTCLAHALEHDEKFGIWGGTSERERRRIWKAQGKAG